MAYVLRSNVPDEEKVLRDQFTWQIRTFWLAFVLGVFALLMFFTIFLPIILVIIIIVWMIYRIIKGWIALSNNQRLYKD